MKKILVVFAFVFFSVVLVPHSFAATDPVPLSPTQSGFVPLAGIPGLTQGGAADSGNLADFFNNLYKYLIGLAAVLAVIEIIWGGLEISTQDSISKQKDGKKRIQDAIFGLVLVLSPVLVFSIINPRILNLSLNLQPLNLTTPPVYKGAAPQIKKDMSSSGKEFYLYTCDPASGNCDGALTKCKDDGGTSGQSYCVDPNQDNKIVAGGKVFLGGTTVLGLTIRGGNGCDAGLVPAIKCSLKK